MNYPGLAMIAALVACAPAPSGTPSPAPASPAPPAPVPGYIGIRSPDTVADFALVSREDFEDEAAGVGLRYERPSGLLVDVYVYPGPDLADKCGLSCASAMLAAEVSGFQESLPMLIQRGHVQAARVTATRSLTPPPTARWRVGHHLTLAVTRDDLAQRSDFYLYYLPRFRVKVRATYEDNQANRSAVEAFTRALVPAIVH